MSSARVQTLDVARWTAVKLPKAGEVGGCKIDIAGIAKMLGTLRKDPKAGAKSFWEALKVLATQRYGNTEQAFRCHSDQQQGTMALGNFQEMCETLGLGAKPSALRTLFEMRLRDDEVVLTIEEFQEALVGQRFNKIRERLQEYSMSTRRVGSLVDTFMRIIALHGGEVEQRRAVTRFQRKLTIGFCMELWNGFKQLVSRRPSFSSMVSCEDVLKVAGRIVVLQEYELEFLSNIFERVDRTRRGRADIADMSVALMLLAIDISRYDQARFLFYIFDDDGDGCLTSEQILRMYTCACIHGIIACGDQPSYDADVLLGDELSLSKARRLYDYTVTYLWKDGVESLCIFSEIWAIIHAHPMLLEELIPGTHSCMWVLRHAAKTRPTQVTKRVAQRVTLNERGENADRITNSRRTAISSKRSPATTERFRVAAAVRFRHAVRGEWDAVNAFQDASPHNAEWGEVSVGSAVCNKLPSLAGVGRASAAGSPSSLWQEEVNSFDRRQQHNAWTDRHRQTLSKWSQAVELTADQDVDTLSKSQSLPSILTPSRDPPCFRKSRKALQRNEEATESNDAVRSRVAHVTDDLEAAIENMPQEVLRHGGKALRRIRNVSEFASANKTSSEQFVYDCHICRERHPLLIPCGHL